MGIMMLQTRHMRYFVAVAEELNFHRAAERLNVSQPALWRQIRDVEASMGVTLLARDPRGIGLTLAGKSFLNDCRDLLERIEAAGMRTQRVAQGQIGTLHIAFNEIAARRSEVPRFLQAFRAAHREINLQLHVLMSQKQIDGLRTGELDAGFLFRHSGERADFQNILIGRDNFVVAMPGDHELVRKPSLSLCDLKGMPLIMPNPRTNAITYERLTAAFRSAGLNPLIAQFADNENALLNLVAAGMGLTFLNTSLRPSETRGVVLRPLTDLSLPIHLELVWQNTNHNPALNHFVGLVDKLAGELDQIDQMLEAGMG